MLSRTFISFRAWLFRVSLAILLRGPVSRLALLALDVGKQCLLFLQSPELALCELPSALLRRFGHCLCEGVPDERIVFRINVFGQRGKVGIEVEQLEICCGGCVVQSKMSDFTSKRTAWVCLHGRRDVELRLARSGKAASGTSTNCVQSGRET